VGYIKDAIKGVSWMGTLRVLIRGLGFFRIAILARLLTPSQFGIFGIAALVLSFLEIATETGINIFLIQVKENIDDFINTAWIVSILRGILISFAIIISAPLIVNIFNLSEVYPLLIWVSMVPLIRGFINPSIVKFQKELMFKKEFILRTTLYTLDAVVVIIFALITRSALSLVIGLIFSSLLEVLLSFIFVKPRPIFHLDIGKAKKIISRGKWITGFGLFDYLFQNVDDFFIGKIMGTSPLGVYQVAYKISSLPVSEIADVFAKVTFPIYSKFESDKKRMKNAFIKTLTVSAVLMLSFGILIFLFPLQIISILLGSNWLEAVDVLKVLAVYGVLKGLTGISQTLFLAIGKQEYITFITFITLLGLSVAIIPLINKYGIIGAGTSAVIGSIFGLIITIYFTFRYFKNDKK